MVGGKHFEAIVLNRVSCGCFACGAQTFVTNSLSTVAGGGNKNPSDAPDEHVVVFASSSTALAGMNGVAMASARLTVSLMAHQSLST